MFLGNIMKKFFSKQITVIVVLMFGGSLLSMILV